MKTISAEKCIYSMSRHDQPVARVRPGEIFVVRTKDCFSNTLRTSRDRFTKDKWPVVNPVTGPIWIDGAQPGDVLAVRILKITPTSKAIMIVEPGMGALSRHIGSWQTRIISIRRNRLPFDGKLTLPIDPMIGVIGTAPPGKPILNGTPGEHGGNMDCKHIKAGSTVFLPIRTPGALLSMGDVHALMADGEVAISGAETQARIVCCCQIIPPGTVATPAVLAKDKLMILASAKTLDRAERATLDKAMEFLVKGLKLPINKAAMLLSLVGDLAVCQVVDPLKTMRMELPVKVLESFGWRS